MQKVKLLLITVLSLLVVFAPVSSVLAKPEQVNNSEKEAQKKNTDGEESSIKNSAFEKIESQGGDEVSEEELNQVEGEGVFGAAVGAFVGGVVGLGTSIANGVVNGHGPARMARDAALMTATVGAAGATIGGLVTGPA